MIRMSAVEAIEAIVVEDRPLSRLIYKTLVLVAYSPLPEEEKKKYFQNLEKIAKDVLVGKLSEKKAARKVAAVLSSARRKWKKCRSKRSSTRIT